MQITALAGAVAVSGGIHAAAIQRQTEIHRVHETRLLMGSITHITLFTDQPSQARAAIDATFTRMTALEAIFSRFQPTSDLSQLNADGRLRPVVPEMYTVLSRAHTYSKLTSGAFDVTVEPVLRLYRASTQSDIWPTDEAIKQASALVDYRHIHLTEDEVRLETPGMALTLDGIAKGYIIDQAVQVLRNQGMAEVLVELGGDLAASGGRTTPWRIAIQSPRPGLETPVAILTQAAMATSGDYLNTFSADKRAHHILNPHNGSSPTGLASATVIADSACEADALATALMVMGNQGREVLETMPNVEALTIDKQGEVYHTAGFPRLTRSG